MTRIVTLCTGNVARSVMLAHMLEVFFADAGVEVEIVSAGTHAVEGQAIGPRTLRALESFDELTGRHFTAHRSHQLTDEDVERADLILCAEADHVAYVRARHPHGASKAVQVTMFCARAPLDAPLEEQVRVAVSATPDAALDVTDPAGHEQDEYDRVASELLDLAQVVVAVMSTPDS